MVDIIQQLQSGPNPRFQNVTNQRFPKLQNQNTSPGGPYQDLRSVYSPIENLQQPIANLPQPIVNSYKSPFTDEVKKFLCE